MCSAQSNWSKFQRIHAQRTPKTGLRLRFLRPPWVSALSGAAWDLKVSRSYACRGVRAQRLTTTPPFPLLVLVCWLDASSAPLSKTKRVAYSGRALNIASSPPTQNSQSIWQKTVGPATIACADIQNHPVPTPPAPVRISSVQTRVVPNQLISPTPVRKKILDQRRANNGPYRTRKITDSIPPRERTAAMRSIWACSSCAALLLAALLGQNASASHVGRELYDVHRIPKARVTAHPLRRDEGACPTEHTSCPPDQGGDCCPSRYSCAVDSCYATTAGPTTACGKENHYACYPVNGLRA